jgi:polar amino acid transport system substrate-binding protein
LIAVLCVPPVQAGSTRARVKASGVLNVVLIEDYPPFGFINASNEFAGFDVDITSEGR